MFRKPNPDFIHPLQEDEFLPPISRWTRLGTLLLVSVLLGTIGLAAVVEYTVTVQAPASVRPLEELGIVQAAAGGIVQRVLVQDNQMVRQGDVIAELGVPDRTRLASLQTRQTRLRRYVQQYQQQLEQLDAQLQTLKVEIVVKADISTTAMVTVSGESPAEADLQAALSKLTALSPLEAKRLVGRRDRLQQQQLGLTNQIQLDQEALQAVNQELDQLVIQSPIDGTIFKLGLHTARQTVQPGDVVAQVVPRKVPLVVKARVDAPDISRVALGQPVQFRISAYPYPDYGTLQGTVVAIAPDVTTPGEVAGGMVQPYYEVTIQPDQSYLIKGDRPYPIQPGMDGRADIISGEETVLRSILRKMRLWADL